MADGAATKDADQARRFPDLARVYDGGSRTEVATIGSITLQIVRDWVVRFNAGGPDGLLSGRAPGSRPKLGDAQREALARIVESGPIPAAHGVVCWRRKDRAAWIFETFGISLDETTVGRELKALSFAKLLARPRHHAWDEFKLDVLKRPFRPSWQPCRPAVRAGPTEIWWQDEARIGQKNQVTRRWARCGTRLPAPQDQRTMWAYIFGVICPKKGKGAGLVLPYCDTGGMNRHLTEISATIDAGAHAVLILYQAGWHSPPKLTVPDSIKLLFLPPRAPELNPQENVWWLMRDNWLSNSIFAAYDDSVGRCCEAWNRLIDQPWIIMSTGLRDWAHEF